MDKTLPQLVNEIYQLIEGQDTRAMTEIVAREFPKSKGMLSNLKRDDLQKVIPLIKEKYENRNAIG